MLILLIWNGAQIKFAADYMQKRSNAFRARSLGTHGENASFDRYYLFLFLLQGENRMTHVPTIPNVIESTNNRHFALNSNCY